MRRSQQQCRIVENAPPGKAAFRRRLRSLATTPLASVVKHSVSVAFNNTGLAPLQSKDFDEVRPSSAGDYVSGSTTMISFNLNDHKQQQQHQLPVYQQAQQPAAPQQQQPAAPQQQHMNVSPGGVTPFAPAAMPFQQLPPQAPQQNVRSGGQGPVSGVPLKSEMPPESADCGGAAAACSVAAARNVTPAAVDVNVKVVHEFPVNGCLGAQEPALQAPVQSAAQQPPLAGVQQQPIQVLHAQPLFQQPQNLQVLQQQLQPLQMVQPKLQPFRFIQQQQPQEQAPQQQQRLQQQGQQQPALLQILTNQQPIQIMQQQPQLVEQQTQLGPQQPQLVLMPTLQQQQVQQQQQQQQVMFVQGHPNAAAAAAASPTVITVNPSGGCEKGGKHLRAVVKDALPIRAYALEILDEHEKSGTKTEAHRPRGRRHRSSRTAVLTSSSFGVSSYATDGSYTGSTETSSTAYSSSGSYRRHRRNRSG